MNPVNQNPGGPKLTLVPKGGDAPHAAPQASRPASDAPAGVADAANKLRIVEALLFQATEPMSEAQLAEHLGPGTDVPALLADLTAFYAPRGINLVRVTGKWALRTAADLSYLLERFAVTERRLSKAALETLAIIAYHQPVTRAEIEDIRGVSTSAGTLDILLETAWVRPRGRRRAPGRPVTYGTTDRFLEHFTLDSIKDLPGLSELKGSGLLDSSLPTGFTMPEPRDIASLLPDELPLDAGEEDTGAAQNELDLPIREDAVDDADGETEIARKNDGSDD